MEKNADPRDCGTHCWHVMHGVGLCCQCPARWSKEEPLRLLGVFHEPLDSHAHASRLTFDPMSRMWMPREGDDIQAQRRRGT